MQGFMSRREAKRLICGQLQVKNGGVAVIIKPINHSETLTGHCFNE